MTGAPGGPQDGDEPGLYRGLDELTAEQVAARLSLERHREGGFFRETYRSAQTVETEQGPRPLCTVILYLLTADNPSRFHRLRSDEAWFYHAGTPAEIVLLAKDAGGVRPTVIGTDNPQALVPAACWMGARVVGEEQADWGEGRAPERRWTPDRRANQEARWTLVSCMVSPGFDYEDFELADREALLRDFPQARRVIRALS